MSQVQKMKAIVRVVVLLAATVWAVSGFAQTASEDAGRGGHSAGQAIADVLREVTNADGAFFAAGLIREGADPSDLASAAMYPTDEIVVVSLTGAQLKQAFERSVALFPESNASFLQLSGFEVVFDPSAEPGSRVRRVTAGGSAVDDEKTYSVAMPSSLGRGGLGYFKIWDRNRIVSTLPNLTVGRALEGKSASASRSRWLTN